MAKKINPKQEIRKALKFCESSQFSDAISTLLMILEKYPNQIEALTILGTAYLHQKDIKSGIKYLEKSISLNPQQNHALNNIGNGYYELGNYLKAISYFEKSIVLNPNDFNPYYNMGRAYAGLGNHIKAISCHENAIKLNPNFSAIKANIAISYRENKEYKKALTSLQEAIKIDVNNHRLYALYGGTLGAMKDYKGAIIAYQKALELNPNNPKVMNYLGANLKQIKKYDEAIEILTKSTTIDPDQDQDEPYHNLGLIFLAQGKDKFAKKNFAKAISLNPNNDEAKHFLASMDNKAPKTASKKYVENLFDDFSENFEEVLIEDLKYDAPKKLINIIRSHNQNPLGAVLDLGCGTGILGEKIKPFCDQLVGVDLSSNMLLKAKKKNIYNELVHQDITEFLSSKPLQYNYYIFTDVFIYIGELRDIFSIIKERSEMGGILVFTTEDTKKDDYFLEKTGRFSHSKEYIKSLSQEFSYQIIHSEIQNLRLENEKFISGGFYLLEF